MQARKLGTQGLAVSAMGLGCMGLNGYTYGPSDEKEALQVLHRAIGSGMNFLDTAEVYGPYTNEELIARVIKEYQREKLIIATKFGFKINDQGQTVGVSNDPQYIKKAIDGSLKRLGVDYIDLYYQHRLDPTIPVEETMLVLADLVQQGKIKYIGLSEVGPGTIRRAHVIHPITAIQTEYSMWERHVEAKILPTARELGIGFVPFSPLGRGFLTGAINNIGTLHESDWRRANFPRIQAENIAYNLKLVTLLQEIATANHCTPAQIALAWLLKQGNDIVPIPGTKHVKYLAENIQAADLQLPVSEWQRIDTALNAFNVAGARYPAAVMQFTDETE